MDGRLRQLDASLADLAAAIPAAQAVAAGGGGGAAAATAAAGGRLHCSVRPLRLRSQVLRGSSSDGGSGSDELTLEVQLRNASRLPLAAGWSIVLAFAATSDSRGQGCSSCIEGEAVALAAPLCGGLAPGAAWQQECQVALSAGASAAGGHLRVLLCRRGSDGSSTDGGASASILLLHSMELDALHLLQMRGGGATRPAHSMPIGPQADAPLQARMLLQLPSRLCGLAPAAGQLLQQLLQHGLSSEHGFAWHQQQQQTPPCPAFSLLLPLPEEQHPVSSGGMVACVGSSGSGRAHLSAQLVPAAGHLASAAAARLLRVDAAATSPAALLGCHHGLCRRALSVMEAGSEAQQEQQQESLWPRLSGAVLLPPASTSPAAAAVDEAQLEAALVELRRVREAAVRLRNAAAGESQQGGGSGGAAAERHAAQQRHLDGALELALAARAAAARVPIIVP